MQNQPPVQVTSQPPVQVGKSSTGLEENVASLLSYIAGWISGLVFFLIEKDSRLVRFHAMQAILLSGGATVLFIVLWFLAFVLGLIIGQISGLLGMLVSVITGLLGFVLLIAVLIAWVMCLIKAYGCQYFKLPIIGNMAEKFSQK